MAALRGFKYRRRAGRWLRNLAHRVDPQPPGRAPGMTYLDFTRGEVWRDGERLSSCRPARRRVPHG